MQELTVSSLLRYLKSRLDNDSNIQKVYVVGEISNYHRHFSGHIYFTLKDETAAINCVMFKSAAASSIVIPIDSRVFFNFSPISFIIPLF